MPDYSIPCQTGRGADWSAAYPYGPPSALEAGGKQAKVVDVSNDLLDGVHDAKACPVDEHDQHYEDIEAEDECPVVSPKPLGPHPPAQ